MGNVNIPKIMLLILAFKVSIGVVISTAEETTHKIAKIKTAPITEKLLIPAPTFFNMLYIDFTISSRVAIQEGHLKAVLVSEPGGK